MDVDKLKIGITREEARKNLRKVTPDMSEEDIETMIDIVENNDVASFSKIMQEINLKGNKYLRLYCTNCKLVFSRQNIGVINNCNKCGQELNFRSFNPWPKIFIGTSIIGLGGLTIYLGLPIIWIGGFLWGGQMIFNGFDQWEKVKTLDNI